MKILFISHDASRSGAPLVLLYLLKWLNSNKENIQLDILFINVGPLEQDFKKVCANVFVHTLPKKSSKFSSIVYSKIISKLGFKIRNDEDLFFKKIAKNKYDLIYGNSVVSVPYGSRIKKELFNVKFLLHIHELNTIIKTLLPNFKNFIIDIDAYIAVSEHVKANLVNNWCISENKIDVIHEFSVINNVSFTSKSEIFTVGASGLSYWRKGNDLFLQVARYIKKNYPEALIKFVWVGNEYLDKAMIDDDIIKMGLIDHVYFVGEKEQPEEEFKNFDIFLLTSREDPFPLVCIEVANLKKPIICFEKASGTAEFVKKGAGYVVPYLDVETMSEKVMYYYNNPDSVIKDGGRAKELFSEFTPENKCPLIFDKIEELLFKPKV